MIVLIGATTENPFFEVNAPSCEVEPVAARTALARRVAEVVDRGSGPRDRRRTRMRSAALIGLADGDARAVLTTLAVAVALAGTLAGHTSNTSNEPATPDCTTTGRAITMTRSAPSSNRSGDPIPTPACTGWPGCSKPGRTPGTSPGRW